MAKPSMPGALQRIYCYVEGQQSIEQGRLAVKMMLAEPIDWHLFATVFEESEPEQGPEDPGLHRVGRLVPRSRKHRRFRDGAKPRQFLAGLPVISANRQRPKHDTGVALRPCASLSMDLPKGVATSFRDVFA